MRSFSRVLFVASILSVAFGFAAGAAGRSMQAETLTNVGWAGVGAGLILFLIWGVIVGFLGACRAL